MTLVPVMRAARGMAALLVAAALILPAPARAEDSWSGERAFVELERLQAEVRMLRALAGAQAALLAWNRERARSGAGPAVLPQALCGDEEIRPWCRALPASFGLGAGRADTPAGEPEAETLAPETLAPEKERER